MKSLLPTCARSLLALAALSTALAVPALRAADAPSDIVVAKPDAKYGVTVTDEGRTFLLNNGIVSARINKTTGELLNLYYKGADRAGHDQGAVGVWEEDPSNAAQVGGLSQSVTIDPAKNGGTRGEVSVKGVTGGQVELSPNAPGGGTYCDIEIRYALGKGDSGVYTYAIFSHPAAYPAMSVGESRYILRVNQTFNWVSVDEDRNMLQCGPLDWGTGVVVHAKEQRVMSQGPYKNSVEHKYSYNAIQFKIPAYGWSSTSEHVGVWFINPTIEYLSGGASKQELQTHWGDNDNPDPILLDYWRGTHYGGGASCAIPSGEDWNKVIGPIFIYVNSLDKFKTPTTAELATFAATAGNPVVPAAWHDNQTALWKDALAQAKKETAQWPYDWVNGVDYPHKAQRGTVSGQVVLNDSLAPAGSSKSLPNLTIGLAYPDAPAPAGGGARGGFGGGAADFVHDAKHYQFWTSGSEDGKFTIPNVRAGNYMLHAWADGVLGNLTEANITVEEGKNLDLGKIEWKPVRYGKQLWDIGYANRDSSELFKGDGDNYWLWGWPLRYALLFPNDLTYTVGKSDFHKDFFFEEVPHANDLSFVNPEAKDPANQKFGWVKSYSLQEYPQTNTSGPWRIWGQGHATTWTIKFNMDKAAQGSAVMRFALAGADGSGLTVAVNGDAVGAIRPTSTNALRYNTDKGIWQERDVTFDAALLKPGENTMTLTVPAGEVTSGVVYDYLRLELNEFYKVDGTPITPPKS